MNNEDTIPLSIYALYDPRDERQVACYVGLTRTALPQRKSSHITEGNRVNRGLRGIDNQPVYAWISKILREGVKPGIRLLEAVDPKYESIIGDLEKEWVATLKGAGLRLFNGHPGGNGGPPWTDERRAAQSVQSKAMWDAPGYRERYSALTTGSTRSMPPGFSEMRSEVSKRLWQNDEFRANQIAKRKGKHTKTHCVNGHEYTPENTWVSPTTGHWTCKTCLRKRRQDPVVQAKKRANYDPVARHESYLRLKEKRRLEAEEE